MVDGGGCYLLGGLEKRAVGWCYYGNYVDLVHG